MRIMKYLTPLLLFLLSSCQQPEFYAVDGQGHRYDDFKGRFLVVNYWATWCAPCIKEIPELNELTAEHAEDVAVWGVNFDQPEGEDRLAQVRRMKIEFPVFAELPNEQLGVEMPQVLPTTLVFDREGTLLASLVGPQTQASLLKVMPL